MITEKHRIRNFMKIYRFECPKCQKGPVHCFCKGIPDHNNSTLYNYACDFDSIERIVDGFIAFSDWVCGLSFFPRIPNNLTELDKRCVILELEISDDLVKLDKRQHQVAFPRSLATVVNVTVLSN